MKVSTQWLDTFVEIDLLPRELAERLTMVGLEVEEIQELGLGTENIVVGQIQRIEELPDSGHLRLCRVDSGPALLDIVCGAPNIAVGDKVPLALPGAVLQDGTRIQRAKIKGQWSDGMLCSSAELGLGEGDSGVRILPPDARVGQSVAEALDLRDTVLEVSITPNRSDCLSILGIAREISAITGKALKKPAFDNPESGPAVADLTSVMVQDPELCPRYTARLIQGVKVGPSPLWVQKRLRAVGLRPINNVVDVTNYVLVELGQPLHAFDFDCLEGRRIVVRRTRGGEDFLSLDGVSRSLSPEMLVIADSAKPVALGGVIGGWESQVTLETRNILLESAYFNPHSIRQTSKRLSLQTEASYRFERGIDPEGVVPSLNRAAEMICRLAGGQLARGVIDCYERPIPQQEATLRIGRLSKILGTAISSEETTSILRRLEMNVSQGEGSTTLRVEIPSFRRDLTREIDLVEEVARHYGYHRIPTTLPSGRISLPERLEKESLERRVRGWMQGYGVSEVITYSFIGEEALEGLRLPDTHPLRKALVLRNPLSQEWKLLRTTLLPGLLQVIGLNLKRKAKGLRLFELGRVFRPCPGEELPREKKHLAGATAGVVESPFWSTKPEEGFFVVKGILEGLLQELHLPPRSYHPSSEAYLHPYKSAQIQVDDHILGHLGEVHPAIAAVLGLTMRTCLFEIDFDLVASLAQTAISFVPLPKYPAVYRDLAIVVDEPVTCQQVEQTIRRSGTRMLKQVAVFDVYTGDRIPSGKKSLAYSLTFQVENRTLTDEEVNGIYSDIVEALQSDWGGKLRE